MKGGGNRRRIQESSRATGNHCGVSSKSGGFVIEKPHELQISNGLARPMPLVGAWVHFCGFIDWRMSSFY
jgi:hypothetical protein